MKKAKKAQSVVAKRRFQHRARKDEEKSEVRQKILMAARQEFAKHDPADVSIRRIAAAAGYSQGTIYQYFVDRRELLIAVKIDGYETLYRQLLGIERDITDSRTRLKEMFRRYLTFWVEHPTDFKVIFSMTAIEERRMKSGYSFADTDVSRGTSKAFMRAVGSFLQGQGAKLDRGTVAVLTSALYSAIQGTITTRLQMPTIRWPESEVMADLLLEAILDSWSANVPKAKKPRKPVWTVAPIDKSTANS
jgi:AcrR family transcriptional regulator